MKRALWIVAVVAIVIAAAVFYTVLYGIPSTEIVGGSWRLEKREFLAGSHRSSATRLMYASEPVDAFVSNARYYGDDCIVYVTLRTMNKQYFAVCGARRPVLLATESDEDWLLNADGMQKMAWVQENGNMVMRPGAKLSAADIKIRALAQPRR